jgi:hypothetical protein
MAINNIFSVCVNINEIHVEELSSFVAFSITVVFLTAAKWVSTTVEGEDYDTAMNTAFEVKFSASVL